MRHWAELLALGVEAVRAAPGAVTFRAHPELADAVRDAVLERVDAMRAPVRLEVRRGFCDACGGALLPGRGGWCVLCSKAREVALREPSRCAPGTLKLGPRFFMAGAA